MLSTTLTIALTLIPTFCAGYLKPRDGIASLPPCAITCALSAAPGSKCTNPADLTCVCSDQDFQAKMTSCVTSSCDSAAMIKTYTVSQSMCGGKLASPEQLAPGVALPASTPTVPAPAPAATPVDSAPVTPAPAQPVTTDPVPAPAPQNGTEPDAPIVVNDPDWDAPENSEPDWDAPDNTTGYTPILNTTGAAINQTAAINNTAANTSATIISNATLPSNATVPTPNVTAPATPSTETDTEMTDNASSLLGGLSATLMAAAFYAAVSLPSIC